MLRTIRARVSILACLVLLFSSLSAIRLPVLAAGTQPTFLLPLSCGVTANVDTYPAHTRHAADLNVGSGTADLGLPVLASASGKVIRIWAANGEVDIDHGDGWITRYSHMDPIYVDLNQQILQGALIGKVGDKGANSPHLHFSIKRDGSPYPGIVQGVVLVRDWTELTTNITSQNCGIRMPGNDWLLSNYFSASNSQIQLGLGRAGDVALVGDWDGDGVDTAGVWRVGNWYLTNSPSGNGGSAEISFGFGRSTDTPVVGDWDGDGKDTIGVKRGPYFYLSNDSHNPGQDISFGFGRSTDTPVVGDWDGDGVDTIGLRRGDVFILSNDTDNPSQNMSFGFGRSTDVPVVGDWNNDEIDTIGVFRAGNWYLTNSPSGNNGVGEIRSGYGSSTDIPVTGNWDGYLGDTIGVVR